jgi:2-octaprenyl-6-methoxyphenol hydroxylase
VIKEEVDILIVGGGLTGATLLSALAGKGFTTRLIDSHSYTSKISPDFDARTLALSPASVRILQKLHLWSSLEKQATPIASIHISEQGRLGAPRLNSGHALGFVVEMQHFNHALAEQLNHHDILAPAQLIALDQGLATILHHDKHSYIQAKLIIAADGAHSSVRNLLKKDVKTKEYGQHAIIANIGLTRAHGNRAYERFTATGPLAMLPMTNNRMSLVWAMSPNEATLAMAMSEVDFLKKLQATFGYRLGRLNKLGKRFVYPLQQLVMPEPVAYPYVFIGNAAHTLHPVAGQGFNLGLRDVATLAQCLLQYGLNEKMLSHYQSMRNYDQKAITQMTNGLIEIFRGRLPGISVLRSIGLLAIDTLPGLKKIVTHHAYGFAGQVPDLACGMNLPEGRHDES